MEKEEAARDSLGDQTTICLLLGWGEGKGRGAEAPPCTAAGGGREVREGGRVQAGATDSAPVTEAE